MKEISQYVVFLPPLNVKYDFNPTNGTAIYSNILCNSFKGLVSPNFRDIQCLSFAYCKRQNLKIYHFINENELDSEKMQSLKIKGHSQTT